MDNIIKEPLIFLNSDIDNRDDAIRTIAKAMDIEGYLNDVEAYIEDTNNRENISSTAIGFGFAAPHAKSENIKKPALGFMHFNKPIVWDDKGSQVEVFFQIAMPNDASMEQLELIANMFKSIIDENFRTNILNAKTTKDIIDIINNL